MRAFLIFLVVAILSIGGAIFWLAESADKNPPTSGEQRYEVDINV